MDESILLFGMNLSKLPRWTLLPIAVTGVFIPFILQGTAYEKIYRVYKLKESLFLTFLQFLCYSSLSFKFFYELFRKKAKLHAPIWFYLLTSLALVGSMALSNYSLERLSFPTQVLFRSSKLIPVMLGSFIFLKKRYSLTEILAVLFIVIGLIGISMSDKMAKNKFDTIGLISVVLSLFCDAFASNLEEKAFASYGAPQDEVIAMIYLFGSIEIGICSLFTGQFSRGVYHCIDQPPLIWSIILFSYLGAVGIQFVYILIKAYGSVAAVMVTSLRKAFTVCLSFILYPDKKFTASHFWSILLIATGLGMNIASKKKKPPRSDEEKVLQSDPLGAVGDMSDEFITSDVD